MTTTTRLDKFLDAEIHSISERTDEELQVMLRLLERAYVHVRIEQGLRSRGASLMPKRPRGD